MKKQILQKCVGNLLTGSVLIFSTFSSLAAVSLDRTRAVFDGENKSITLHISNENKQLPYLAQAWLEDENHQKMTTGPLVLTPPVQRLEPGKRSLVRVEKTQTANSLAQDRESLFYFNLREIPPKSEQPNTLQIALQTKIKLFYRPVALQAKPDAVWQDQLVLHKIAGGYRIENPTPYYITIIGMGNSQSESEDSDFDGIMIAPFGNETVKRGQYSTPYFTYINDYGGRPTLAFRCDGEQCTVIKDQKK
ncbi:fimbrial biogenesis chaperone [Xenorhabdus szentirmaii]|uniref:Chaperone protein papD n=1 Tax=Xenorhabdus szentirmaii DSM 16338 TaxID=1427518 RepID=W1IXP1_9GAMM|nr:MULTISPECIES: fimbria/pilus periplasmic chaperone [Xenorhabdus]MBD2791280.1 fimbria/pilus periplasmic chaperone [Xenorhabdus sp. CUL]MBD2804685.1 fimbria/pilus periplasmic chaperone [Xenorhabdus sp. ZM]MBD2824040.1 fimbria/pilus periplasmic chaperone [Xenorhabdus sp. 5]PHM34920.1 periplasmid chaperone PapD protein [Xenorhabdus szentirmaii DSM 16338]CDL82386.1 Chaperone protein papD [Xenorhabdus szentirmaii DSM 16338]